MTFREQLFITIVDKAVIGLMVAAVAFVFSKALEKVKSDRALANELAKQRVAKIAEVWEALDKYEADTVYWSRVTRNRVRGREGEDVERALKASMPKLIELNKHAGNVRDLIDRNRFWLTENLYERFGLHCSHILNHLALLVDRPSSQRELEDQLISQLSVSRQSIADYLKL